MTLRRMTALSLVFLGIAGSMPAYAGVYGDTLGKCLVSNSTEQDKQALVKWVFSAIALNPSISPYVNLPEQQRTEIDKKIAAIYEKLLGDTCKTEASEALRYEGESSFGAAFQLFGQVAGQQMFAAPEVAKGSEGFLKYLDIESLQKKLGITPQKPAN